MLFNSLVFLGFITVVFLVYPRLRLRGQNVFLLVASYIFYGYWDWRFNFLLFIPLLDTRPALRERHAEVPCYFVYDGHWNTEWVRCATVYMAQQWRKSMLPSWVKSYRAVRNADAKIQFQTRSANES